VIWSSPCRSNSLALCGFARKHSEVEPDLDGFLVLISLDAQPEGVLILEAHLELRMALIGRVFLLEVAVIVLLAEVDRLVRPAAVLDEQSQVDCEFAEEVVALKQVSIKKLNSHDVSICSVLAWAWGSEVKEEAVVEASSPCRAPPVGVGLHSFLIPECYAHEDV
jgi:hypothetical protein